MPERRESGLRLLCGDSRFETTEDVEPARAAIVEIVPSRRDLRLHHHRRKDIRRLPNDDAPEVGGSHADHGERMAIDQDAVVHYAGIGPEAPLPISEAEYDDGIALLHLIIGL